MAEPGIQPKRLGVDLGDAVDRAGGRQQHQVDPLPHWLSLSAQPWREAYALRAVWALEFDGLTCAVPREAQP